MLISLKSIFITILAIVFEACEKLNSIFSTGKTATNECKPEFVQRNVI